MPARDRAPLIQALTGGRTTTEQERLALESANLARYFQHRQELLRDSLSAVEVAHLLGTSRQTPHDRVKAGTLLAVQERGGLRFPRWQFDPSGPDGVLPQLRAGFAGTRCNSSRTGQLVCAPQSLP